MGGSWKKLLQGIGVVTTSERAPVASSEVESILGFCDCKSEKLNLGKRLGFWVFGF